MNSKSDALNADEGRDLDVVGHYARPDIFQLHVDTRAKQAVTRVEAGDRENAAIPKKALPAGSTG